MLNVASLINQSNIKKNWEKINELIPLNAVILIKLISPSRGSVSLSI